MNRKFEHVGEKTVDNFYSPYNIVICKQTLSHFDCTMLLFILFQSMGSQSRAQIKTWDMRSQRRCPWGSRTDGPMGGMEGNSSHWEGLLKLERLGWTGHEGPSPTFKCVSKKE